MHITYILVNTHGVSLHPGAYNAWHLFDKKVQQTVTCLTACLAPSSLCRIRHQRKRPEHIPPSCPALSPASRHRLPGHGIYLHVRGGEARVRLLQYTSPLFPCPARLARLGSARLVSPDNLLGLKSGELSPSFRTVTSEQISDAQSAFTNTADAGGADTNSPARPWLYSSLVPPTPSAAACKVALPARCCNTVMFPRSVGGVAVISLWILPL